MDSELLTAADVRKHLAMMVRGFAQLGVSQNGVARRIGITNGHLSRVLSGQTQPGDKVLWWLGMRAVTRYTKQQSHEYSPEKR